MNPLTIDDVAAITKRVELVLNRIESLVDDEVAKEVLPPLPLRLTLGNLEGWVSRAEENAKRPKAAKSRDLLLENGIAPTSIPSAVLEAHEEVKGLIQAANALPSPLVETAKTHLGVALTKTVEDGKEIIDRYESAAAASASLENLQEKRAWLYSAAMQDITKHLAEAASIAQRATAVQAAWEEADTMNVLEPSEPTTLAEAEEQIAAFDSSLAKLNDFLAGEGLGRDEVPDLAGKTIVEAARLVETEMIGLRQEKQLLAEECQSVARELAALGPQPRECGDTLESLRRNLPELRTILANERKRIRDALGEASLDLLEKLSNGLLPTKQEMTDKELGAGIRCLIEAGYSVTMEAYRENH